MILSIESAVLLRQRDHQLRILDIGCGTGFLLKRLAERFPDAELYGIDTSASMLEQAQRALRNKPRSHVVQAELGRVDIRTFHLLQAHLISSPVPTHCIISVIP